MSHFYRIGADETASLNSDVSSPAQARNSTARHVASITTKLALLPSFIDEWKMIKMHEVASQNPNMTLGEAKDELWGKRKLPNGEVVKSAEFGTQCHQALEDSLISGDIDREWHDYVEPFFRYTEKEDISVIHTELSVFDDTLNTAGTIDLVVELPNGRVAIMDFKTRDGKGKLKTKAYAKDAAQLAACSVIYSRREDLGYQPKIFSVLIDAVTAELHVKEWTERAQLKGLRNFIACSNFYDAINDL